MPTLMSRLAAPVLALAVLGPARAEGEIVLDSALAVSQTGRWGRAPLHLDAVEKLLVSGRWQPPRRGDVLELPGGEKRKWQRVETNEKGWLQGDELRGGWVSWKVRSGSKRVYRLEARGHSFVSVGGVLRTGDPYATGWVRVPVLLRRGENELLFRVGRGRLKARLVPEDRRAYLNASEATLPDFIAGQDAAQWGAVVVVNASASTLRGLVLEARTGGDESSRTHVPDIPPWATRKVPFPVVGWSRLKPGKVPLELALTEALPGGGSRVLDEAVTEVDVREPHETRRVTFRSSVDDSVQYYAVNPMRADAATPPTPALFLSLHGAGVRARGQAGAYAAKSWGHLVAPTNRRPFGFDWEDWGRLDALEVLAHARRELGTDPARTYLVGHSMGGHGTWHLGVTFPDQFAAIGPSAGWASFWSYGGSGRPEGDTPVEELLWRASSPSDTLALVRNLDGVGVYVLHGVDDDNVPVSEARGMRELLEPFHRDFLYHEQPDARHWWNVSDEPGADCVDWAPMFDFLARHALPPEVRQVDFVTLNPGISARRDWATVEAQEKHLAPSRLSIRRDPGKRRFVGTTENVARLSLDLDGVSRGDLVTIELDGTEARLAWPSDDRLRLERMGGAWVGRSSFPAGDKGPRRNGTFKDAFRNRVVFVYGTKGKPGENAWALNKARYDAETFWFRGNASVEVIPDLELDARAEPDRSVVLYGHAGMNSAWESLLGDSPVQVRSGVVQVGGRRIERNDLAVLAVRPRPGSDVASVGIVAGTGERGARLTDVIPYFVSGVAYPDLVVLDPSSLSEGASGVHVAGFFGNDWSVASGEIVWRE